MADSLFPLTRKYLRDYGKSVEGEIKTRLQNSGKEAGGTLYKSIKFRTFEKEDEFVVTFYMAPYGIYVDRGVKGNGVNAKREVNRIGDFKFKKNHSGDGSFLKSLKAWCKIKGINPKYAYAIRRSIWTHGIKPTNFFTIPTTRRQKQFEKKVAEMMAKDIDNNLSNGINS